MLNDTVCFWHVTKCLIRRVLNETCKAYFKNIVGFVLSLKGI